MLYFITLSVDPDRHGRMALANHNALVSGHHPARKAQARAGEHDQRRQKGEKERSHTLGVKASTYGRQGG